MSSSYRRVARSKRPTISAAYAVRSTAGLATQAPSTPMMAWLTGHRDQPRIEVPKLTAALPGAQDVGQ
jgi:hypothetical protein